MLKQPEKIINAVDGIAEILNKELVLLGDLEIMMQDSDSYIADFSFILPKNKSAFNVLEKTLKILHKNASLIGYFYDYARSQPVGASISYYVKLKLVRDMKT